jgi:hypothetical protein
MGGGDDDGDAEMQQNTCPQVDGHLQVTYLFCQPEHNAQDPMPLSSSGGFESSKTTC